MMPSLTYFTCTLGQAASGGLQQPHRTIPAFLESKNAECPNLPAIGFAKPTDGEWASNVWTFGELHRAVWNTFHKIRTANSADLENGNTVAMLCHSDEQFLLTWLALMKLGKAVLIIAPQCTPAAIANLCKTCGVFMLFASTARTQTDDSVAAAGQIGHDLKPIPLPFDEDFTVEGSSSYIIKRKLLAGIPRLKPDDLAYLHHTSGTSSGMPKPIPQTHNGAVGVLPSLPEGSKCATFTTTPLYHGGPADIFRAWTSNAMIWLFPGKAVPVTAQNVFKCLEVAEKACEQDGLPPVRYLSCVPYVLRALVADPQGRGLRYLQQMDLVGVGGAALPADVGDQLVSSGVNLVSRYGSAECGFLLSSHREYAKDRDWQYLRADTGAENLRFENEADGNLAELIVLEGWSHMAKVNREDGSFATSDLFAPHDHIANAWKYHSRADSQLTLVTGKKFDPGPLEDALAASKLLTDVLIFGDGQAFPGALLFRSSQAENMTDEDLINKVWPFVAKLNLESQDHARLARHMLKPMPALDKPLEKSSKGTLLRGAAQQRFAEEVAAAYEIATVPATEIADEDILQTIKDIVRSILNHDQPPPEEANLFSYGVNSMAGMQIRHGLRPLLPQNDRQLPINIVEDCGNIEKLAGYVLKRRRGEKVDLQQNSISYMRELVEEYSQFRNQVVGGNLISGTLTAKPMEVVVLTGATGALGAHVLDKCRGDGRIAKIYCLVRGASHKDAFDRVSKVLAQRQLASLDDEKLHGKVVVLSAILGDEQLGLDEERYERLAREATLILHLAWSVNFRMNLRSFAKDSIASVRNLINLALASPMEESPRLAYCSSVASVLNFKGDCIPETIIHDPSATTQLGYSQSKWVAEQICDRASKETRLRGRILIYRVGQLAGDTERGVWNAKEAFPLMLSIARYTHSLPDLQDEVLNWLPVDVAATALLEGARSRSLVTDGLTVLHVVNEHDIPHWNDLLRWMEQMEGVKALAPAVWISDLENVADHPALQLLDFWREAYAGSRGSGKRADGAKSTTGPKPTRKAFAMDATKRIVPSLRKIDPVSEVYFGKIWAWIKANM
ncbi:acetyl-CoA synthetase-like protein [Polychaeton citri CBS 116435]|uniref:Acetyl-CoA synthetase-like protein n=1 Tax=Polychaeton citri CBS 116435 TaxID=1314669 RepID=A0A9P4QH64_9PEZI|nr:acetyl-CoA synthetase-like protein [Polychaeton citri CBS 116435]